jgi:hypothetical protein
LKVRERETLIARIRHLRRVAGAADARQAEAASNADAVQLQLLEARVEHLEQMVQGLQDSVHREFERESKRIAELEARIEPAALGAALSRDARERGL